MHISGLGRDKSLIWFGEITDISGLGRDNSLIWFGEIMHISGLGRDKSLIGFGEITHLSGLEYLLTLGCPGPSKSSMRVTESGWAR